MLKKKPQVISGGGGGGGGGYSGIGMHGIEVRNPSFLPKFTIKLSNT